MDISASICPGRPGPHAGRPSQRWSLAGALAALLLVSACSTVTPPSDPLPASEPAPARPEADERATVKPPARKPPRRITRIPSVRPPLARPSEADSADDGDEDIVAGPEPQLEPLHAGANRPYRLNGRLYRPMTELQPFRQRGIASWYGNAFHGRRTATGDRYDMHAMTAAHPTLPLPSYARVRNLKTGKTVIVRVNDRGPFANDRVIDLSRAAARHLDMLDAGVASVEVELVLPDDDPADVVADSSPARR